MNYENAKEYLYSDGSWRDIYVFDTTLRDLNKFLDFVRPMLKEDSFTVDGEVAEVPRSYEQALQIRKEHACLLCIPIGRSTLNCHFFDDTELELDLVPKHYDTESEWNHLDRFLNELSNALGKDVVLTPENQPNEIYIRYEKPAEQGACHNAGKPASWQLSVRGMKKLITILLSIFSFLGCKKEDSSTEAMSSPKQKSEYKVVDDKIIDSGDYFEVIDPVWWKGNIYGTFEEYETSLSSFSHPQRLVFAVVWYESEVNNGGHDQFFTNSTGIVWKDAIEALETIGASSRAAILTEASTRIGGNPSFDRDKRIDQVESSNADFDDLDDKFYGLDDDFYDKMESYIKEHRKDFYFEGVVTTPDI